MITIEKISDKDLKEHITLKIMHELPEWFSPPEDVVRKSITHKEYPFFAVFNEDEVIGFIALKIHNKYTAEIYTVGILKEYHRCGAGSMLVEASEKYCRENGHIYLTVKTLDESAVYEPYNQTRAFYKKKGFIPLEVLTTLWNEENPCLFLVKYLKQL